MTARAPETIPQVRARSRAAVFAVRTALAAGVAPALACGGLSDAPRERSQDVTAAGGSSATAAGGSSAVAMGGSENTETGGGGTGGGGSYGGITIDPEPAPEASADAGDGGFAPVPIYGGVFPDPLARVRV